MAGHAIRPFYADWESYNQHIVDVVRDLTDEQLAVRPSPDGWPIWATLGHMAGVRIYWLCRVLGEPGAEATPFPDPATLDIGGWEDDPGHPRGADELVFALDSSWSVIGECLDRWTPGMLAEVVVREHGGARQAHTRQSILLRLLTHDAYHAGELSQTLGIHGLPQIDLWPPEDHSAL